jgi:hypothetical protein
MNIHPFQAGGSVRLIQSVRRHCVGCNAWLPLRQWFGGWHYCHQCTLRQLGQLIDEIEAQRRS